MNNEEPVQRPLERTVGRHTPGPWFYIDVDGIDFTAIATVAKMANPDDLHVEVLGSSEFLRATEPDLRLMAAAPELLAALQWAARALDPEHPAAERARLAIAKALGWRPTPNSRAARGAWIGG